MKILSLNQIKKMDQFCIESESISSIELMERASKSCFEWIKNKFFNFKKIPFIILSGPGNNGGDGLSLSKKLYLSGAKVTIYVIHVSNHFSKEFLIFKNKILKEHKNINLYNIYENDEFPSFEKETYLIDAIFGIGLNRVINSYWKSFFDFINEKKFKSVLSVDIPSGVFMEKNNKSFKGIIKANYTLTFQVPKLPFFFPDYEDYIGNWILLDIGWKKNFFQKMKTKNFFIEQSEIKKIKKVRKNFSHKGNYGHGLLIGGSYGMIGSMILSGKASFRSGIGKLSMYIPNCGIQIIQSTLPEAILKSDKKKNWISNIILNEKFDAIGIGMGMGTSKNTIYALESFFLNYYKIQKNIVIDADALNILSKMNLKILFPKGAIITPHPKEFKRLFGTWKNDYQKIHLMKKNSKKYHIYIILKGYHSVISTPYGEIYFNSTGNSGMATSGSGDILTGIIVGLLSQKYSIKESCIMGVYLHGLSGDLASEKIGKDSIMATDIINFLPKTFQKL